MNKQLSAQVIFIDPRASKFKYHSHSREQTISTSKGPASRLLGTLRLAYPRWRTFRVMEFGILFEEEIKKLEMKLDLVGPSPRSG